jgi:hypothetical protein
VTEDLYNSANGRIFNNMPYVRYVHLTKAKHIHKMLNKEYGGKGSVTKKKKILWPGSSRGLAPRRTDWQTSVLK